MFFTGVFVIQNNLTWILGYFNLDVTRYLIQVKASTFKNMNVLDVPSVGSFPVLLS